MRFKNRAEAGRLLAQHLTAFAGRKDVIVLGMPRGGVPVAAQVADALHAPLDVLLASKLGVPGHEELAFGALTSAGARYLNQRVIDAAAITPEQIAAVTERTRAKLQERERLYREDRTAPSLHDRIVILVDDGIATGASISAAIHALRDLNPKEIVVAAPVAPEETVRLLQREADLLIVLDTPPEFYAVGHFYDDFNQTTDEEVIALLQRGLHHDSSAI